MITATRSWLASTRGRRWIRYSAVSLISVATGQAALGLAFGLFGLTARPSNYVGFAAGAIPSYYLNRRWTWGRTGRSHLIGEVLPFWVLAIAGLVVSTWAVGEAESFAASVTRTRSLQTLTVMGASLAAYGALWVTKFAAFDRILFAREVATGVESEGLNLSDEGAAKEPQLDPSRVSNSSSMKPGPTL